jgi:hypothetical protein
MVFLKNPYFCHGFINRVSDMKKIVFVSGLVLIAACVYFCKSCGGNGLNGKEFDCYDEGLRTLITFESDSTVVCSYSSFDFVASISDNVYGHYEYRHPNVFITWDSVSSKNIQYNEVPNSPDSIIINESLDTLCCYTKDFFGDEKIVMSKPSFFKMNENTSWIRVLFAKWAMLQIAPVYLCIRYFIYVLLFYIALYLSVRFYRRRKRVK